MVATKGFGMGIDKPNIRLVIHRTPTANLEAYAQEAGRAGRDGEQANVILYYSPDQPVDEDDGKRSRASSDHEIQTFFLAEKYVRRSDVIVMRAFLRKLDRRVGNYLYCTNDEVLEFFNTCMENPELASLQDPYEWPSFPERSRGNESLDHADILDRGHLYEQRTRYVKRVLDVIYRIRPAASQNEGRYVCIEEFRECGANVIRPELRDYDGIFESNAYYGGLLRKMHISKSEFWQYLSDGDLLELARRLELSPSETAQLLSDIKHSETGIRGSLLLNFSIVAAPHFGPAAGKTTLAAWRNYAGASRRANKGTAHERARKAGRKRVGERQETMLDDWFYWKELSWSIGWEILPGPALYDDEHFGDYLSAFMALHDQREQNDWAAYHRLLTDYVGVQEDGSIGTPSKKCLRGVLLGYLKTFEVVAGDKCYGCNHCVPDEQFEQYTIEQRTKAIVRMSSETEDLLVQLEKVSETIPGSEEVTRVLEAVLREEDSGRSVSAYVQGLTGRILQDTPDHRGALMVRAQAMIDGVFGLQPHELISMLNTLESVSPLSQLDQLDHLVVQATSHMPEEPEVYVLRAHIAGRQQHANDEAAAWKSVLGLVEASLASAEAWTFRAHDGLAQLYAPTGKLADEALYVQHGLLAAKSAAESDVAMQWYSRLTPSMDRNTLLSEFVH